MKIPPINANPPETKRVRFNDVVEVREIPAATETLEIQPTIYAQRLERALKVAANENRFSSPVINQPQQNAQIPISRAKKVWSTVAALSFVGAVASLGLIFLIGLPALAITAGFMALVAVAEIKLSLNKEEHYIGP